MNLLTLTNKNWIDLIFENRNQSYGAYLLRKENNVTLFKSFMLGSVLFTIPFVLLLMERNMDSINTVTKTEYILPPTSNIVEFVQVEPVHKEIKATLKSKLNVLKFTELKPVAASTINEDVAIVTDLFDGVIGTENIMGDENGSLLVNDTPGNSNQVGSSLGTETNANTIFDRVEIQATPNGGLDKFYKAFAQKYNAPVLDEGVSMISVIVRFVVEIDGSITNISILRDPGMGAGKEAVRVLKTLSLIHI